MKSKMLPNLLTFLMMVLFWIILSGRFDSFHLSLGVIASAGVSYFSSEFLFGKDLRLDEFIKTFFKFVGYIPYLFYQIFLANLHLLYLAFHPRMKELIDPKIVRFQSRLKKGLSLVTLANSITLTPGTITVFVSMDGAFRVHAIDKRSREDLPGEMEERILKVFERD